MQTRKLGLRALTLALAGVLTLGLAACEETQTVTPLQPSVLTISPTGTVTLDVGDRITVAANLLNPGTNANVTWASSNNAVATVDQNGTVVAVAPGIATITATATGNAGETLRAALVVRVLEADIGPPPSDARVFITGVTSAAGDPLPTDNVRGTVVVRLEVEPGTADSLVVSVGNRRACAISFAAATALITADGKEVTAAQVPLSCTVNTATLGVPNGPTTVTARLIDNGTVIASNQQTITLNNISTINAAITATQQATNPRTGLIWQDGAVIVRATPAIFGAAQIARVNVILSTANGALADTTIAVTTMTDGAFIATFPETSTALRNLVTPALRARITAVTTAGDPFRFPQTDGTTTEFVTTNAIRYDNRAPVVNLTDNVLPTREFVGGGSLNATFLRTNQVSDTLPTAALPAGVTETFEGVNAVRIEFFALQTTSTSLSADTIIARGTAITDFSTLAEGQRFAFAARICDALNNCVTRTGPFVARVDVTAPQILDLGIFEGDSTFVTDIDAFQPAVTDDVAGFSANALLVSAVRIEPVPGTTTNASREVCFIGDEATNAASDADDDCEAVATGLTIPVGDNAYFRYTVRAIDQAGNVSATRTFLILEDLQDPEVLSVNFPINIEGGANATFTATITDNIDLNSYDAGQTFATFGYLPFVQPVVVDNSFGLPLTTRVAASQQFRFINGIRTSNTTFDAPVQGAFQAIDQANRAEVGGTAIPAQPAGAFDFTDFAQITAFTLSQPANVTAICLDASCPNTTAAVAPTSILLTARVAAGTGQTTQPFERVFFYVRYQNELGDQITRLIAVDETGASSVTANERRFDFTATLTNAMLREVPAGTTITVFALGVDDDGDAFPTELDTLTAVDD